jgi:hypothetical protein
MHDSASTQPLPAISCEQVREQVSRALVLVPDTGCDAPAPAVESQPGRGRGHPIRLAESHLWLGLLWAVLEGLGGSRALARCLATHALGRFAPVSVSDSALVQRLQQAGSEPLQSLFSQLGTWLQAFLAPPACDLAPFASRILALDETKLDALVRRLPGPRQHRVGDPARLAGKLAALFDIRQQRWLRLQYVSDALRNCKLEALALIDDLPWHSLLLFDLGYFSFPWFDYLTERGIYWISRSREKTRYQVLHIYYQHAVLLDALVWLGSAPGPRAGRAGRFGDGKHLRL